MKLDRASKVAGLWAAAGAIAVLAMLAFGALLSGCRGDAVTCGGTPRDFWIGCTYHFGGKTHDVPDLAAR